MWGEIVGRSCGEKLWGEIFEGRGKIEFGNATFDATFDAKNGPK